MGRNPRSHRASTHTATKGTAKLRPVLTTAQKFNDFQNAIKNNPPGVRLVARNMNSNRVQLAHYVGFNKTGDLKDWFENSPVGKGIIQSFYLFRENKFGNSKQSSPTTKKIFCYAYSPEASSMFDKPIPLPKDPDIINPTKTEMNDHATWTYVVAMHKIMVQDPKRFFAEPITTNQTRECSGLLNEASGGHALRNGHSPEDWNRAYWLLAAKIRIELNKEDTKSARCSRSDEAEGPLSLTVDQERTRTVEVDLSRASDASSDSGQSLFMNNKGALVGRGGRSFQGSEPGGESTELLNSDEQKVYGEMLKDRM